MKVGGNMQPVTLGEGKMTGCVYALAFPRQQCIYVGSTKRGGTRLREHGDWLRGSRHPNTALQEAYDLANGYWLRHVILNVYGASNAELRNYEWGISIHLTASYLVLNDDSTTLCKFHLEDDTMKEVVKLVDSLMQISTPENL